MCIIAFSNAIGAVLDYEASLVEDPETLIMVVDTNAFHESINNLKSVEMKYVQV